MNRVFFIFAGWMFPASVLRALEVMLVSTLAPNVPDQFSGILSSRPPMVPVASQVVYGQPLFVHLLLKNPAHGEDGKVLVEVEKLDQTLPDGTIRPLLEAGSKTAVLSGERRTERDFSGVMLSSLSLVFVGDQDEPPGKHRITVRVRDGADGSVAEATTEMELVKTPSKDKYGRPMELKEINNFISRYYMNPKPDRIPEAFAAFLKHEPELRRVQRNYNPLPVLCGFAELYRLNPQLRPGLVSHAGGCSPLHKRYVAMVLAGAGASGKELAEADADTMALFSSFGGRNPLTFDDLVDPAQLDALWVVFFVTGRSEPLRRIVNELRRRDEISLAEARARQGKLSQEERRKLMNHLLGMAAKWSLDSNARRHKLVFFYLEAMLKRKQYPDDQAGAGLAEILSRAAAERRGAPAAAPDSADKTRGEEG